MAVVVNPNESSQQRFNCIAFLWRKKEEEEVGKEMTMKHSIIGDACTLY